MLAARPEVFNHNIETVRRLHARMRGAKASYDKALWLLARAKEIADYPVLTKSGIIVGLGETNDEVVETMRDLRANGVDVVTIGQYLQPSREARADRPLGAPRRVPLVPRAGRGARVRLGLLRPARALELPRRRAAPRGRDRPRRGRVLAAIRIWKRRAALRRPSFPATSRTGSASAVPAVAMDLGVVDVLLGRVAPNRTRVRPDDVRVTVAVGVHPHVVAQEAGLRSGCSPASGSASSPS